ncbi:MAG TPA: ammonium transporter [Coriobacteriia bacterium]
MNAGDTAWMLASAALVLFMTPGLALFYGGMVRAKNVLSTIMQSFFAMGLVSVLWALVGYTLAFGPDKGGLIGGLQFLGLGGVIGTTHPLAPTVPHSVFAAYQGMFAIITPALITGAFAERMKFKAWVLLLAGWLILVYSPLAHWVWGGGWIGRMGALDFAGGTVVHISSAAAALACVLVLGKRRDHGKAEMQPHNLTLTLLGTGILWFGWFGFNAGSAYAANGLAGSAFLATHLSAAAGMLSWTLFESWHRGKATTLGAASGAVAGLVGITPAAGFVTPLAAIAIGLVVGAACYGGILLKDRFGYDDALDVVGVHGVGGATGAILTGVFAAKAVNAAGSNGLLYGNPALLVPQLIGVAATIAFSFTVTFVLLKAIDALVGLRVDEEAEFVGLDLTEHAETGYIL